MIICEKYSHFAQSARPIMRPRKPFMPIMERTLRVGDANRQAWQSRPQKPKIFGKKCHRHCKECQLFRTMTRSGRHGSMSLINDRARDEINTGDVLDFYRQETRQHFRGHIIHLGSGRFEVRMPCKACKSENLQNFEGELTASLPDPKGVSVPPVYVCQNVLVCLDCGFAELIIPTSELNSLKKGKAAFNS